MGVRAAPSWEGGRPSLIARAGRQARDSASLGPGSPGGGGEWAAGREVSGLWTARGRRAARPQGRGGEGSLEKAGPKEVVKAEVESRGSLRRPGVRQRLRQAWPNRAERVKTGCSGRRACWPRGLAHSKARGLNKGPAGPTPPPAAGAPGVKSLQLLSPAPSILLCPPPSSHSLLSTSEVD